MLLPKTSSKLPLSFLGPALAGALVLLPAARAALADGPPPPPPEAYEACASKASGDACTVSFRDMTLTGTCTPEREGSKLFCRPDRPPPPPPQAFEACGGKKEGDACTVSMGDRTMDGTCRTTPDGKLACAPITPPAR